MGAFGTTLSGFFDGAFDSSGNFFLTGNSGPDSLLYSDNTTTGLATLIGTVSGFNTGALDFETGKLYAGTLGGLKPIITINTTTAVGTAGPNQDPLISTLIFRLATAADAATTVPEPATWLLLATGCVGLLALGWRSRRRAA